MNHMYTEKVLNLLNSVTQNLAVTENGVILIKHYNSLDIKQEIVEKCFFDKKDIKYVYHEFDGSVMADAYEPFLSSIKNIFYEEYNMTMGYGITIVPQKILKKLMNITTKHSLFLTE